MQEFLRHTHQQKIIQQQRLQQQKNQQKAMRSASHNATLMAMANSHVASPPQMVSGFSGPVISGGRLVMGLPQLRLASSQLPSVMAPQTWIKMQQLPGPIPIQHRPADETLPELGPPSREPSREEQRSGMLRPAMQFVPPAPGYAPQAVFYPSYAFPPPYYPSYQQAAAKPKKTRKKAEGNAQEEEEYHEYYKQFGQLSPEMLPGMSPGVGPEKGPGMGPGVGPGVGPGGSGMPQSMYPAGFAAVPMPLPTYPVGYGYSMPGYPMMPPSPGGYVSSLPGYHHGITSPSGFAPSMGYPYPYSPYTSPPAHRDGESREASRGN